MSRSPQTLIATLQSNKRFMGTCPCCAVDFRLADALLFSLKDAPPTEAVRAIKAAREQVQARKQALAQYRERMTKRAEKTAQAVNLGKMVEKIVPSFSSFAYATGDCRALFEPIDYVVFSGLTKSNRVDALLFIDVKSGKAGLNQTQKAIKRIVDACAVGFDTTRQGR